eukprot:1183059-Prymnesium_polylepis.1
MTHGASPKRHHMPLPIVKYAHTARGRRRPHRVRGGPSTVPAAVALSARRVAAACAIRRRVVRHVRRAVRSVHAAN